MRLHHKALFIVLLLYCFMPLIMSTYGSAEKSSEGDMELGKEACWKTENLFDQVLCYAALATKHEDVSICNAASHDGVRYQCYSIYAERQSNPDACEEIPSSSADHKALRDACISDVAKKIGDFKLCEKVQTQGLRDSCYWGIVKKTGDTSLCEKIQDNGLKSGCTGKPIVIE